MTDASIKLRYGSPRLARALLAGVVTSALWCGLAHADVVVVVGAKSAAATLTKEQVADLFMGKLASLPGAGAAAPIDQGESSPLREEFYSKVTGKSAAQVKSYWAKMAFTGKGTPPKEGSNSAEVKKLVAGAPGGIGYIEKSAVDDSVKVVFTPN